MFISFYSIILYIYIDFLVYCIVRYIAYSTILTIIAWNWIGLIDLDGSNQIDHITSSSAHPKSKPLLSVTLFLEPSYVERGERGNCLVDGFEDAGFENTRILLKNRVHILEHFINLLSTSGTLQPARPTKLEAIYSIYISNQFYTWYRYMWAHVRTREKSS